MSEPANPRHFEITLGSGRRLRVTRFLDDAHEESRDLHICPRCTATTVEPDNWIEIDQGAWRMTLSCPDCGWSETDTYSSDEVELFESELDRR